MEVSGAVANTINAGGLSIDLSNTLPLITQLSQSVGARYSAFNLPFSGTSVFQVPAGFRLIVYAVALNTKGAASPDVNFIYSDNELGYDHATPLTNEVYILGATGIAANLTPSNTEPQSWPLWMVVPENKYFHIKASGWSGQVIAYTRLIAMP